jgi:hypothetical protein
MLHPDGSEKAELLDVLVRPYPERVAGDPVSYAFDEESGALTLVYRPDRAITAPTLIVLPPRRFPAGARVGCDGCASEVVAGQARITRPPRGDPATVTVTPVDAAARSRR